MAGVAAVSMYHQYRQYQSLLYCHANPMCYGGNVLYLSLGGESSLHNIILNTFRVVLVLWRLLYRVELSLSYIIVVQKNF